MENKHYLVNTLRLLSLSAGTREKCGNEFPGIWKTVYGFAVAKYQGSVFQSVVSLTSSLRVISLTVLADSIHNIQIFFAEKM